METTEFESIAGPPCGWFEAPFGQFRANKHFVFTGPQTLDWSFAVYNELQVKKLIEHLESELASAKVAAEHYAAGLAAAEEALEEHAAARVAAERKRLRDEFWERHKKYQMHHNYYACLVREMDDGLL